MNKKLCRYIATSLVFALLLAVPSFAAHHYTGNQYAVYGSARVGVEAYIYYSTNTSSNIYVTSSAMYVRNYTIETIDNAFFKATEIPSYNEREYPFDTFAIAPNGLQRIERSVNASFSKSPSSNGYVLFQSKVAVGSTDASGIPSAGVVVGWDTFCYPNSFSSSFHS